MNEEPHAFRQLSQWQRTVVKGREPVISQVTEVQRQEPVMWWVEGGVVIVVRVTRFEGKMGRKDLINQHYKRRLYIYSKELKRK
jgi:hypothetical protein